MARNRTTQLMYDAIAGNWSRTKLLAKGLDPDLWMRTTLYAPIKTRPKRNKKRGSHGRSGRRQRSRVVGGSRG